MNGEKRFIPGTNPKWGRELPDNRDNSLVDKYGENWNNPYNFDERNDDVEESEQADDRIAASEQAEQVIIPEQADKNTSDTSFDNLSEQVKFDPESAEKAREEEQLSGNPTETPPENPENA